MEKLLVIWLYFGYSVYWIGWIGSVAMYNVSLFNGIWIGVLCFVLHIIIYQILYFINGGSWIWKGY